MTLISNRKPGQPENSPTEPLKKAVSSALRASGTSGATFRCSF
jgi:hypothetical protein